MNRLRVGPFEIIETWNDGKNAKIVDRNSNEAIPISTHINHIKMYKIQSNNNILQSPAEVGLIHAISNLNKMYTKYHNTKHINSSDRNKIKSKLAKYQQHYSFFMRML